MADVSLIRWLRSHLSVGGKLIAVRTLDGRAEHIKWENGRSSASEKSGAYALEGTLTPVEIDFRSPDRLIKRAKRLGFLYGLKPEVLNAAHEVTVRRGHARLPLMAPGGQSYSKPIFRLGTHSGRSSMQCPVRCGERQCRADSHWWGPPGF